LGSFRAFAEDMERLAKADPSNAGWQRDLSVSYEKVGDVLVAQGNLPEALTAYRDSLAIRERLAKADPGNAGWQADLAASHGRLADAFRKQGEASKARDELAEGREIMVGMTKLSPDNAVWKRDLAWFEAQVAALEEAAAFEAGDFAKAAALQTALADAQEKAETAKAGAAGPLTAQQQGHISWYRLFTREFGEALAASERGLALAPDKLWISTNRAHALMFLGRAEEARAAYLEHKGQNIAGQGVWDEAILKDFAEFEKRGLTHPQMAEIRQLLAPAPGNDRGVAFGRVENGWTSRLLENDAAHRSTNSP
jgi:tetratricopeptide (TPR) repeat protein